jgi:uncharacterized protein (TIGR00369 family)
MMPGPKKSPARRGRQFLKMHAFNALVGFELVRVHRDGVTLGCKVRDELLNGAGVLHGGVTASLADAAVGSALFLLYPDRIPFATVEMKINYFRPVRNGRLLARCKLLQVGTTLCVGQVSLTDEKRREVGVAIATYMFLDGADRSLPVAAQRGLRLKVRRMER